MKKVVLNKSRSPACLSNDALYLLLRLGFPLQAKPLSETHFTADYFSAKGPNGVCASPSGDGPILHDDIVYGYDLGATGENMALRSHPALVKVVELLGERVNGSSGRLRVQEVPDQAQYCLSEYDGLESVRILAPDLYVQGYLYNEPALPADTQVGVFATL